MALLNILSVSGAPTPSLGRITIFQDSVDGKRKYKRSDGTVGELIDIGQGNIFKIQESYPVTGVNNSTSDSIVIIPTTDGILTVQITSKSLQQQQQIIGSGGGGSSSRRSSSVIGMNYINGVGNTALGILLTTSGSLYSTFYGTSFDPTPNPVHEFPMPMNGTLSNFYITKTSTGGSLTTFTVLKNTVATSLIVTMPAASPAAVYKNITDSVSFVEGDVITVRYDATTQSGIAIANMSLKITS